MKKFLAIALLACSTLSAHAQAPFSSYWDHNGSVMGLAAQGNQRAFVYVQPRPAMAALGVQGTTVFEGFSLGYAYQGVAYVFSASCPPYKFGYEVNGPVSPDQLHVTLFGQRPVVDPVTCFVGTVPDRLDFNFLDDSF